MQTLYASNDKDISLEAGTKDSYRAFDGSKCTAKEYQEHLKKRKDAA